MISDECSDSHIIETILFFNNKSIITTERDIYNVGDKTNYPEKNK